MTKESSYHPAAPLGIAVALSAVAGFVDAHMFLHVARVFVANMSGNMIQLGMNTGLGDWSAVATSALALVAFLAGVVAATVHHDRRVRRGRAVHPARLLVVEAALVAVLIGLLEVVDVTSAQVRPATFVAVALGAIALGMQTMALRRVGAVAVATTYGTGTIVRIGEKLALGVRRADRDDEHRRRVTIVVLVTILLGYIAGAALAAALGRSPWTLVVPVAVLIAASAVSSRTAVDPVGVAES